MVKLVKNAKTHTAAPILIISFISPCFDYLLLRRAFEKVTEKLKDVSNEIAND
jgi:hypothetical protein